MKKYLIRVEGGNVKIKTDSDDGMTRVGFFATRLVEATSEAEAKSLALDLVRQQLVLEGGILGDASNPSKFEIDEITEVEHFEIQPPGGGFTFYPEE